MEELTKADRLALVDRDEVLFDRMAKVAQDPFVDAFGLQWLRDEDDGNEGFSCMVVGRGRSYGLTSPRSDWKQTLVKALDMWDVVPKELEEVGE